MAQFQVTQSFVNSLGRKSFVMAGHVSEGELCEGMFANVGFGPDLNLTVQIDRIELVPRGKGKSTCLCFEFTPEELELWHKLKISNRSIEIAETSSDL